MIRAFTELTEYFKSRRINLGFHFTDNEAYKSFKMTIATMNIKYQLALPSNHRANNSERAIQTFKNHFITGLCSEDKDSHLQLWDRLLHQATINLNFLRQSGTLHYLSAYTHIFGSFYYNRAPLPPPGTRIVIHNSPNN